LVTTLAPDGSLNAAPYSLFNVVSHDPPIMMISVLPHPDNRLKDTASNILATKEFVVNLVPEALAESMNITCIDAPPYQDELKLAQLGTAALRHDQTASRGVQPYCIRVPPGDLGVLRIEPGCCLWPGS